MTTQTDPLIDTRECPTTLAAALYTTPAGTRSQVDRFNVTNPTGASITIDVYLVPPAGSPGATNKIISAQAVSAGVADTLWQLSANTLSAGGTIWAQASAAGLVIRCTGRTNV